MYSSSLVLHIIYPGPWTLDTPLRHVLGWSFLWLQLPLTNSHINYELDVQTNQDDNVCVFHDNVRE